MPLWWRTRGRAVRAALPWRGICSATVGDVLQGDDEADPWDEAAPTGSTSFPAIERSGDRPSSPQRTEVGHCGDSRKGPYHAANVYPGRSVVCTVRPADAGMALAVPLQLGLVGALGAGGPDTGLVPVGWVRGVVLNCWEPGERVTRALGFVVGGCGTGGLGVSG
jgi:hypothetical protein